ncbi:hypothetical protein EDD22DRAFT_973743 [Suillus occidentalis]|nr:hypothetical protein EDD22DRAFT_973743 [Suillus occidentalis]
MIWIRLSFQWAKLPFTLISPSRLWDFTPEARTSFITYWLPSFLKHEYIALQFVSQATYERAASLSISPQPDVVTRICMLFQGIRKEHLGDWADAQMQAEKDVGGWVDVVGVDPARAGDATLFRVLEWGGMELLV